MDSPITSRPQLNPQLKESSPEEPSADEFPTVPNHNAPGFCSCCRLLLPSRLLLPTLVANLGCLDWDCIYHGVPTPKPTAPLDPS